MAVVAARQLRSPAFRRRSPLRRHRESLGRRQRPDDRPARRLRPRRRDRARLDGARLGARLHLQSAPATIRRPGPPTTTTGKCSCRPSRSTTTTTTSVCRRSATCRCSTTAPSMPGCLALPQQHVERDERRGCLRGELAYTRLRGMKAVLHRVEVEASFPLDDDLAVERGVRGQQLAEGPQLREVAQQRTAVAAPERELAVVVLEHTAEAVPLRLVLPLRAGRYLLDQLRLLRRERDVRARRLRHRRHASGGPPSMRRSRRRRSRPASRPRPN